MSGNPTYQDLATCSSILRLGGVLMSKQLAPVISLLLASALPAFPQTSAQGSAADREVTDVIKGVWAGLYNLR